MAEHSNGNGDNVFQFPRAVMAECRVRECSRQVERLTKKIEAADPDTQDGKLTALMAERMLEFALSDLMQAKAEVAGTVLTHNGVSYSETVGRA